VPYTLFIVTNWAEGIGPWPADMFLDWKAIERLAARGATVGSHSVSHPKFSAIDGESATEELVRSRAIIVSRLGRQPDEFAIPLGQSSDWNAESTAAALAAGYTRIYAQTERDSRGRTIPRTFITRWDNDRVFAAALAGRFDRWEEWV
jgi:peptidoglycan/xylan/chitin deacetylase (PgdA/CDA1 family)